jgi:hypothetical protein
MLSRGQNRAILRRLLVSLPRDHGQRSAPKQEMNDQFNDSKEFSVMSSAGQKIIEGLKEAVAGNFSRVTIDGQVWIRHLPSEECDPYNNGYTHEALHAAHIACDLWDSHVHDTRCAFEFPDVKDAAGKAAKEMYNVYQLIGQKMID